MKLKDLILPVITLVIVGILLGSQWKRVSEIRDENGKLHERTAEARVTNLASDPARPELLDPYEKTLDWETEAAAVFGLFTEDPAKAEARLSHLPADLRAEIFDKVDRFHKMGEGDEIAFSEIVRRQLDEKGRVAAITARAERVIIRGGDFAAVDEYLNSVYAAPDERERSAEAVARRYNEALLRKGEMSAAKLTAMREWVGRDAPGSVDRLTGEALGNAVNAVNARGGMDFAEASSLVLGYGESTGMDDVLHSFLNHLQPSPNNAEARKLAEKITDPGLREILRKRFQ